MTPIHHPAAPIIIYTLPVANSLPIIYELWLLGTCKQMYMLLMHNIIRLMNIVRVKLFLHGNSISYCVMGRWIIYNDITCMCTFVVMYFISRYLYVHPRPG